MNFYAIPPVPDKRQKLEEEKLELENKELRKSRWIKPPGLGLIATLIASITTLFILWNTGTFDANRKVLQAETKTLEWQKIEFTMQVDSLHKKVNSLEKQTSHLNDSVGYLNDSVGRLVADKERYAAEIVAFKRIIKNKVDTISSKNAAVGSLIKRMRFVEDSLRFRLGYASTMTERSFMRREMRFTERISRLIDSLNECQQYK